MSNDRLKRDAAEVLRSVDYMIDKFVDEISELEEKISELEKKLEEMSDENNELRRTQIK